MYLTSYEKKKNSNSAFQVKICYFEVPRAWNVQKDDWNISESETKWARLAPASHGRRGATPGRARGGGGGALHDAEVFTGRGDTPAGVAGGHVAGLGRLGPDEAPGRMGSVGVPAEIVGAKETQVKVPRPRRPPLQGVDGGVVPREAGAAREGDGGGARVGRAITIVTAWGREGGGVSGRARRAERGKVGGTEGLGYAWQWAQEAATE